ncbi:MAG: ATP-binding protein [Deltaproteobacteria bacterium]|nr:ATP-binding protein [Deltaproteobacteria bacterium]
MRYILHDLEVLLDKEKKMAFVAGPRQVGKTTLAQAMLKATSSQEGYFNWDIDDHRRAILKDTQLFWQSVSPRIKCLVFDEIHKYPRWKKFLKGFYDAHRNDIEIIVTGSGRLDVYQRGGDSLFGRYHQYRLFPYSVGELVFKEKSPRSPEEAMAFLLESYEPSSASAFEQLWNFNGFPEPLFQANKRALGRWQNDHHHLILREDLRDLTQIRELGLVENLIALLPERVGSPLSVNSLRENLEVNFKTVQNWLMNLDRLYYLFFLRPYTGKLARTLKREEKVYFYDWSELHDEGKRFENLVALHLLKTCAYWTDAGYGQFSLHYVRDKEKREVDFLICKQHMPFALIEAKYAADNIDSSLPYFKDRLKPKFAFQVIGSGKEPDFLKRSGDIYLCAAPRFLAAFL